ncbi:hypothetical protein GOARA_034_00200 [Gordonia araii NBRC 100433]|uniref:Transmembrane protein n=1 Tax=Gordonia araii NBRC 100433 TaxID=1073574 RepID=G7H070_9ACTN|nr:hypothetical protein [Gordonia araii]NNG98848.1 hypothetical protein [Gordonia araii NBRC 100433]GAB09245.1 hypothetical protein GOARA_034_00200 [Gordonia araii NBRC 100433]
MSNPNTDTDVIDLVRTDDDQVTERPPVWATEPTVSTEPATSAGVPVGTLMFWLAGCVLLVVAALCLPRLSEWAGRYGSIPVFLGFFLVMSLAGRWFWAGTDAIVSAIRGKA